MYRWGILGSGRIASDFVTALKYCVPDAEVVAVGARSLDSAQSFAAKFAEYRMAAYGSYDQLVSDPKVQIVYVSVLHPFHKAASLYKLAIEHGKHVLCEKPFTLNAKDAREVVELARKCNVIVMEAMWTRFFPAIIKVRELLQNKVIGDVRIVEADFGYKDEGTDRITDLKLGGGALLDVGVYPISFANMVYGGKPSKVVAMGDLFPSAADQQVGVLLSYGHNRMAVLHTTVAADTRKEASIIGTLGIIKVHDPFWAPTKKGKQPEVFEFPLPKTMELNFTNSIGLHYEAKHLQSLIASKKQDSDIIPSEETIIIMEIMDEIRRQIGVVYPDEVPQQ